jgi:hypothetical protein
MERAGDAVILDVPLMVYFVLDIWKYNVSKFSPSSIERYSFSSVLVSSTLRLQDPE